MSLSACAALVERADPDRFLATMATPVEARRVLFPLYALNVEVSRAPWVTQEAMIAEMRLQWWRDALEEIANGATPRKHEVVDALAEVLTPQQAALLDGFVAARRWDIYSDAFEDPSHLDEYIDATSGHLTLVVAQCLGAADESVVREYAYGVGVANLLRAVPELEARGRKPLVDGTPQGVRNLAQAGLDRIDSARARKSDVSSEARGALRAGWRARSVLRAAAAVPERVIEGKLEGSEFARKASLIWSSMSGRI